jgi:hypothetical protein
MNLCPYFSDLMYDLDEVQLQDLYVILLFIYELHDN